jgi:hypothetical protein
MGWLVHIVKALSIKSRSRVVPTRVISMVVVPAVVVGVMMGKVHSLGNRMHDVVRGVEFRALSYFGFKNKPK